MRTQVGGQGNTPTTCPTSPQVVAGKLFLLSEYYRCCVHAKDHWIVLCSIEDKLCKGDSVGNNCRARVHENPGRRLLCACCSQQQGFYLFKIFICMGKFLDFFLKVLDNGLELHGGVWSLDGSTSIIGTEKVSQIFIMIFLLKFLIGFFLR